MMILFCMYYYLDPIIISCTLLVFEHHSRIMGCMSSTDKNGAYGGPAVSPRRVDVTENVRVCRYG